MEIDGLSFSIHDRIVLERITVAVPDGQIAAVVGPNRAGRTTLLRCLAGDLPASAGSIRFEGQKVGPASETWKIAMGVVPDTDALFDELTVGERLSLAATLFGMVGEELAGRVGDLLILSGLDNRRDALGSELSAGMRRRLSITLALIHSPRLFLFDEPLNALDYASGETFSQLLRFLRKVGRTVLVSGHSPPALLRVSDWLLEMDSGRIARLVDLRNGATSSAQASREAPPRSPDGKGRPSSGRIVCSDDTLLFKTPTGQSNEIIWMNLEFSGNEGAYAQFRTSIQSFVGAYLGQPTRRQHRSLASGSPTALTPKY